VAARPLAVLIDGGEGDFLECRCLQSCNLTKRKENEIMNKMPVARFIEIKATQEIGSCPCVSISAEVLIPQPCKIENIDNDKIKIAIEYAVATYVKIEEKKDSKK
jgi:hypothetical protein